MQYLLDANVLIDANRDYYPISDVPEFWDWLIHQGNENFVKIPLEIYEEVTTGTDELAAWLKQEEVKAALLLEEEVNISSVQRVVKEGYAADLTDAELERLGRDPFLISYALQDLEDRCIVTTEGSRSSRRRANRHVPDVCNDLGVNWAHTFQFTKVLGFNTHWAGNA